MSSKVLIIIPAYNEQDSIVNTVTNIKNYGYDYVVINDGSKDNTQEICERNSINIINLPQNLGIGGAIQTGHKYARLHGYDIDIQFDGDGQHDAAYIDSLIKEIEAGSDLAVGSRFLVKTDGFQSTIMRRVGISWLTLWLKLFTKQTITDPTSGFRACNKKTIELFCENYPTDYPEPESIALAIKSGLKVSEISVKMLERQGGKSSIKSLSSIYYMVKVSLAIIIVSLFGKTK